MLAEWISEKGLSVNKNLPLLSVNMVRALTLAGLALLTGCAQPPAAVPLATSTPPTGTPPAATVQAFLPPEPPSGYTPKAIAFAQTDMVSAANPLAVQAGVGVLARGGSAVDAAIAVQMVLNVVEPQSSGIGGGAFMLHLDAASRRLLAYDGRETAPAAATPDQFLLPDGKPMPFLAAVDGGLSVGTPGVLRMLERAHQAHGRLPWADLFAPAIRLAAQGFAISPRLSASIAGSAERIRAQGEPVSSYFLNADGSAKAAGTWLANPALAATLQAIASGGAQAFYSGEVARDIVAKVRSHPVRPGRLTLDDLARYTPQVREPVCATYRVQFRVCGMPPPSSGGLTTLQTLGMLERFDLAALPPNSTDAVHLVSEAYRLAYADRAKYIADADFVAVPVANRVEPGKRPRSSMAPTMVFNARSGALEAVLGSPGGSAIIPYVTKTLIGLIDWRLDIQQAINLPNFGAQTSAVTAIEQGSLLDTPALRDALAARGHTVQATPQFTSGLHGVVFNGLRPDGQPGLLARHPGQGQWAGGADPRREGVAAGNSR